MGTNLHWCLLFFFPCGLCYQRPLASQENFCSLLLVGFQRGILVWNNFYATFLAREFLDKVKNANLNPNSLIRKRCANGFLRRFPALHPNPGRKRQASLLSPWTIEQLILWSSRHSPVLIGESQIPLLLCLAPRPQLLPLCDTENLGSPTFPKINSLHSHLLQHQATCFWLLYWAFFFF